MIIWYAGIAVANVGMGKYASIAVSCCYLCEHMLAGIEVDHLCTPEVLAHPEKFAANA